MFRGGAGNHPGQVHARQAWKSARRRQRLLFVRVPSRRDTARQRALLAYASRQSPRVHIGNRNDPLIGQVLLKRSLCAPTAGAPWRLPDDEPGGPHAARLHVLEVDARVADLRIGQGNDLPGIGGIGKNLLVTGHRRIENHLADGHARYADRLPTEQAAVF